MSFQGFWKQAGPFVYTSAHTFTGPGMSGNPEACVPVLFYGRMTHLPLSVSVNERDSEQLQKSSPA